MTRLALSLDAEDPFTPRLTSARVAHTLAALRAEPTRGRAVVLEDEGRIAGYALLISFWSNELGGEVCTIDELYVVPALRGRGFGRALIEEAAAGGSVWPQRPVALELEVSPQNVRARALYERIGFSVRRNTYLRWIPTRPGPA
ncbi:MAG: GNAT family N-acetyltransferase [Deltaproteobacteria bacterium]|nr:GNAT family N-acetyltransferase [Deltaproteobacteria bacterium]